MEPQRQTSVRDLDEVPWTSRDTWFGILLGTMAVLAAEVGWFLVAPKPLAYDAAVSIPLIEPILVFVAWVFGPARQKAGWTELGFRRVKSAWLMLTCGLLGSFYLINCANAGIITAFGMRVVPTALVAASRTRWPIWLILATVLVAPITEEIFFRGFGFAGLTSRFGWKKAALFSSIAFAALHLQPLMFLPLLGIGYLLALLYRQTNSIWPPIVLHGLVNAIGTAVSILVMQMSPLLK